ncbi:signal peptidase I [Mogibacterium sp. NSJ-24]|jgi:signal peptidase I|uniref:Signal peptidase I n=1 Tax=Lentihominibacter hominis TaxID=2763645 RepID=A0A926I7N4_9FIRM|nr:signal peptidase I [Lentihominibacter hominis]MBC8567301.1 signal peptidase I [Lentihominibacter hominis]
MNRSTNEQKYARRRKSPYMVAVALAIVMFMVVAPEVNEGDAMSPTINDGQLLVVSKTSYSAKRGIPDRDKLVILEKNAKNAQNVSKDNIIARVAGLPGETVEIKDGKIYIDGDEYVTENGIKGSDGDLKVKLTKDEVFLLCDNRDKYIDSRNEKLGPVDMKDIKGNVLFCIWPFSRFGGID